MAGGCGGHGFRRALGHHATVVDQSILGGQTKTAFVAEWGTLGSGALPTEPATEQPAGEPAKGTGKLGKLELGDHGQELLDGDLHLQSGQVHPEALVGAGAEGHVQRGRPIDVEFVGSIEVLGVAVRGTGGHSDCVALVDRAAADLGVDRRNAAHRGDRRLPAQGLLDHRRNERRVGGDELGGHVVSGHVDGKARILSITPDGDSMRFAFEAPEHLALYIAPKGSVALDGTSLTVNEVDGDTFGVNIIPHTQAVTTWGRVKVGDLVNLEVDTMARYVARLNEGQWRAA